MPNTGKIGHMVFFPMRRRVARAEEIEALPNAFSANDIYDAHDFEIPSITLFGTGPILRDDLRLLSPATSEWRGMLPPLSGWRGIETAPNGEGS